MIIVKNLAEKGIRIHALGVGTLEGAPVQNQEGNFVKKEGNLVLSKLEKGKMQEISNVGNGRYLETHFSDRAETKILEDLSNRSAAQKETGRKVRLWKESFYLLLIPVILVILLWFRRGYLFVVLLLFLSPTAHLGAFDIREYFKNHARRGKEALASVSTLEEFKSFLQRYAQNHWHVPRNAPLSIVFEVVKKHSPKNLQQKVSSIEKFLEDALYRDKQIDINDMIKRCSVVLQQTKQADSRVVKNEKLPDLNPT